MAAPSLLFSRACPLNRSLLLQRIHLAAGTDVSLPHRWYCCKAAMAAESAQPEEKLFLSSSSVGAEGVTSVAAKLLEIMEPRKDHRLDDTDYRKLKDKKEVRLDIVTLTKEILHSKKYLDGEHLTHEDERAVVEKLLAYHPHSKDKIGCGLDSIFVDRHPQFRQSRCLFILRTDGSSIDFSYKKCLPERLKCKCPVEVEVSARPLPERFIREHYKRISG